MIHDVDFSRTLRDIETIFQINKSNLNFHILTLFLAPEYSQRQDKKNELLFSPIGPQVPSGLIFKVLRQDVTDDDDDRSTSIITPYLARIDSTS